LKPSQIPKNKIAFRLSVYFGIALLTFSIVIGGVFLFLFRCHTIIVQRAELVNRADSIASKLGDYIERGSPLMGMDGYGPYLRSLRDVAGTDVWIVDKELNVFTDSPGFGLMSAADYSDLPPGADRLIKEIFRNNVTFSNDSSGFLTEFTLTVGSPIFVRGDAIGVVLLHGSIGGIETAVRNGFLVLIISIVVALFVAFLLSVSFSFSFASPLNKMKDTALLLAEGNYKAKNGIKQDDEIGQLAATLDVLAERLESASRESAKVDEMRRSFVANVSHELRTPITVMRGSLEALIDGIVADPQLAADYHRQMLNETLFLERLVRDLLDLSRLQNMDFAIEKQEVCVDDIVEDVIKNASRISEKKQITIIALGNGELRERIFADYGRIRQMLMIVLDNAIKFSPKGASVEIIRTNRTISIRDHGVGIVKDDIPHIFDRFYKARNEQNKTGSGLGLAIARQIAERHNIYLSVNSKIGNGTTFTFQF
jgi:signal transduction histidine kinase